MAFRVSCSGEDLTVALSGWDWLMNWRRAVRFELRDFLAASVEERGSLEGGIDHRVLGFGTHDGRQRPGRRRVGTMLGRTVPGRQFWAVPACPPSTRLLVLEIGGGAFARAVLAVDDAVAARVTNAVGAT